MILFEPEHVQLILQGIKTQTRRTGKHRWKIGAIRQAKTGYKKDSEFAKIRILAVRQERLVDISESDALAEGYKSIREYMDVFIRIYGSWNGKSMVWVIDFELVNETKID